MLRLTSELFRVRLTIVRVQRKSDGDEELTADDIKRSAVGMVIVDKEGNVLLVKKSKKEWWTELAGKFVLPVETRKPVDKGDDLATLNRGLWEETGLRAQVESFVTKTVGHGTGVAWFGVIAKNPQDARPESEEEEIQWVPAQKVIAIYDDLPSHPLSEELKQFLRRFA